MDRFPKPLGGRNSTPEEQGHVVVFLNSDAAGYITGANLYADGGFSAGMLTSPPRLLGAVGRDPGRLRRDRDPHPARPAIRDSVDAASGRVDQTVAQRRADLEEFFHPEAVALVGSVNRNAKPERLRAAHSERWGDRWYLVNAKGGAVGDIPDLRARHRHPRRGHPGRHQRGHPARGQRGGGVRQARRALRPHLHRRLQRGGRGGRRPRARGGRGGAPLRHPGLRSQHQHQRLRGPSRAAPRGGAAASGS